MLRKKDVDFEDREEVIEYIHSILDDIYEESEEVMPLYNLLVVADKLEEVKKILDNPSWDR